METTITQTLIEVISGIAQMGLIALLGLVFAWFKANTKSNKLKSALETLEKTANTTAGELQQLLVEGWKAVNADGKLTAEEIKSLKERSLKLIKARMGADARDVIIAAGINLEDLILAHVEAAVTGIKAPTTAVKSGLVSVFESVSVAE